MDDWNALFSTEMSERTEYLARVIFNEKRPTNNHSSSKQTKKGENFPIADGTILNGEAYLFLVKFV